MLGLHKKCGLNAVVLYINKGKRNITFDSYATPGFAEEFLGSKEQSSECGELISRVFRERFVGG